MLDALIVTLRLVLRRPWVLASLSFAFVAGCLLPSMTTAGTTWIGDEPWSLRWALLPGLLATMSAQAALRTNCTFLTFAFPATLRSVLQVVLAGLVASMGMAAFLSGVALFEHAPTPLPASLLAQLPLAGFHLGLLGLGLSRLDAGAGASNVGLAALVWTGDRLSADAGSARWAALLDVGSWLRPLDGPGAWVIGLGTLCVWAILLWPRSAHRSSSPA